MTDSPTFVHSCLVSSSSFFVCCSSSSSYSTSSKGKRLVRKTQQPAKSQSLVIISTTLPPDLGHLRFQDAATDSNHSNQALGLQHSPPRSADEVHAAIEQFLLTDSTECVSRINNAATTSMMQHSSLFIDTTIL